MALNQFGAILTHAIEMEESLTDFYEGADDSDLQARAESTRKNAESLARTRRQNVTEITLEPIEGLDENDYTLDLSSYDAGDVANIEATVQQFYEDILPKINVLETRQVLKKCLKLHKRF